ncbi:MAG TPA: hypothetical protein VFI05_01270 [Nitrospiraceae bacterium]|nr:hypothetical protein [Nitrospiraceae bacterium]
MRARIFFLIVLIVSLFFETAFSQSSPSEDFLVPSLKQADADRLASVHSDEEAKAFFSTHLREAFGLKSILPDMAVRLPNKSKTAQFSSPPPSLEWTEIGGRLTGELAAKQLAVRLAHAANGDNPANLRTLLDETREQRPWLFAGNARPELNRAVMLATVLSDFSETASDTAPSSLIEQYDLYLDRTYPQFIGSDSSWLTIAEREGSVGVRQRSMAFWDENSAARSGASEAEKQALASHYFHTRLRSVFLAQVTASAIRAEAVAEQLARTQWVNLKTWPDKARETKGLARLCGTWQWTIHNHQHHQDQKVAMVFPPPDADSFAGPRPAKTVVLGDAIYLRWEFPGVVQEDSLLFTGEGQRLEGSFVNSSGAWGSITGKRTAACAR